MQYVVFYELDRLGTWVQAHQHTVVLPNVLMETAAGCV